MESDPLLNTSTAQDPSLETPRATDETDNNQRPRNVVNLDQDLRSKKPNLGIIFLSSLSIILAITTILAFQYQPQVLPVLNPLRVRIYTNNIRYDNRHPDPHEPLWKIRKHLITDSIKFNTGLESNVVCLQEVLHNQLKDILKILNEQEDEHQVEAFSDQDDEIYDDDDIFVSEANHGGWSYYGIGRTDGMKQGEYAPILYKTSEWIPIDNQTFWLSSTPESPSVGWDAALERIVTMITLQSKINPTIKINFFNTHFDHKGITARRESSKLIIDKMENYNSYPSFLCGDFNTQPTDEPYKILTKHGLKDSRLLIDDHHSYGYKNTFTGFEDEEHTIIDYIWSPSNSFNFTQHISDGPGNEAIKLFNFGIISNKFKQFMSDHRPVIADFIIYK